MLTPTPLLAMADTILYVTSLVADRPRAIDEVIDYFGDPSRPRELPTSRILDSPPSRIVAMSFCEPRSW